MIMEPLDLEPRGGKDESKGGCYLSRGWVVFICVVFILFVVVVAVLVVFLPKCTSIEPPIEATTSRPTTPSGTPAGPGYIWDDPLLPDDLTPSHYAIDLTIDLDTFIFTGKTSVQIHCVTATNLILLHAKNLTIHNQRTTLELATSNGPSTDAAPDIGDVRLYPKHQYILVELAETLEENVDYILGVEFEGRMMDDLVGLYRSSYTTPDQETRWMAATFFSPANARKAFPCFDEPARKANFTFTITHNKNYTAIANMERIGPPEPGPTEGWVTTRFHTTPIMSTYILAYSVLDYAFKETVTTTGVLIRAWAREDVLESVTYGMELHRDILQYYEEYFDVPFPLTKMDVVALTDFAPGAMENWGLIMYRERRLLFDANVTSTTSKQTICNIIAHELGHQYFGNLVTHAWWDYILLKEGFASYMEYIGIPHVHPDWEYESQFLVEDMQKLMAVDALTSSRPVETHVETVDEISQMFDTIAYSKGPAVLRMCDSFLGKETFKKGLKIYINRHAFSTATNDQLWECLQEAADADGIEINVTAIMHTWVLQMGYPTVNITRDYTRNDVINFHAEQTRFLLDPLSNATSDFYDLGYVWWIPLSFSSSSSSEAENALIWMENGPADASINGTTSDWLLANLGQAGYYRVNYDTDNWKRLSQQLVDNHTMIPLENRGALIDDAFNLGRAGDLSQAIALDVTLYLVNETQYVPWKAATSALQYLNVMLCKTGAYGSYQRYMLRQVSPLYDIFGWENDGSHLDKLTRGVALSASCGFGHEDCMDNALTLYRLWMTNASNNPIAADFRSIVYCAAIKGGGQDEWTFAFDQYQTTTIAAEKNTLMFAMACSNQPWILNTYLSYTLDSTKIRTQDADSVVQFVADQPIGSSLAWDFFRANWDHFRQTYGANIFALTRLVGGVTEYFNTDFSLQQLLAFMTDHPDQGTGEVAFKQAVEQTKANIRWMDTYLEEVQQWLDNAISL